MDDAERLRAGLVVASPLTQPVDLSGFDDTAHSCGRGQPARGLVLGDGVAPAHYCRDCSTEHCWARAHVLDLA
ncbi:MAG TPA: hypothetical protein VIM19_20770 [Actinomycetes bacterium]